MPHPSQELLQLIRERAWLKEISVTLSSGKASNTYVDCRRLTLHGKSLQVLSRVVMDVLLQQKPAPGQVAGVSVGGDPLVAGVIWSAAERGQDIDGLLVRKEAKKHGLSSGKAVEGAAPQANKPVWLVEDVISTGSSSAVAAQHLLAEGYALAGILCIVDREMGGVESLQKQFKVPVVALTTLSQITQIAGT